MPEGLALGDMIQQYANTVIQYKGKPHKVKQVGSKFKLLDLQTQRTKDVEFSLKTISPVVLRLGYMNYDSSAIYLSRKPAKQFQIGISYNNCSFSYCKDSHMPIPFRNMEVKLSDMSVPELYDMLMGHYPSLEKAYEQARACEGSVAFDKQFAVDSERYVAYKCKNVGIYDPFKKKIKWDAGKDYLETLLGNQYEKSTRTFAKETCKG